MRGAVEGYPTPHPLSATLPGLYQGQPFTEQLCAALDEVLSPIVGVLDNLGAYLDVETTPEDLLPWLAHWVGLPPGIRLGPERLRGVLAAATRLHGGQGTARGVALAVEAVVGHRVVVQETGGAAWSTRAGDALPGLPRPAMVVEVHVPAATIVDVRQLEAVVTAVKPAHVVHRVEVVTDG